ncbi:Uncharacterised protein [Mycobacteroides abscessus subsp. abscessus]|uniref:hypothetical protein n=1 Tax=Mycobacteroides abscessus TaxID=36809 RepID=UPI000928E52D|nr:hypothetical protein [Mycobacteroides abscessus]SIC57884.1 Uncharacterised protein [Mycobacteroides abscessus subsp. abscessus]SIC88791.1 Uncharacterised protein [Mycobacteroides abscessus subsp. abscessus]SID09170.1 Uncharacterised protein [Mycobacteroides abscessus subsp. abscessus]SID53790.1 Uncharacterised protein [Mycobacteroides abscessus subsp. abscessus]SKT54511.1 Uncharacterised protein [Mycobacteroides abscessus subsp. abscessus]
MSPLLGIVLMFTALGLTITAVLLVTAEVVKLLGWSLAVMAAVNGAGHPGSDRTVFEGMAYSFLGVLWVTASGSGIGRIGVWLLSGDDEGAFLGAVCTIAMLALWWWLTLRLKHVRAAVSRARGVCEDPWTWIRQNTTL